MLTSSRQALGPLFLGIVMFAVFQVVALMIVVSLLFSAIVQERYREVGLLRAMGARPNQIMTIILAESAIVTGLGGVAGLAFPATDLCPLAWLLLWPSRSPVLLATTRALAGERGRGSRLLGGSRSRRFLSASLARARAGPLCAHSDGSALT